jgi:hypothetical protein
MTPVAPPDPTTWEEGWVVFDAVRHEPMIFSVKDDEKGLDVKRACIVARTEAEGIEVVRKVFGEQDPNYPPRFPVRRMPRDVTDCLGELRDRLNLDAVYDGENVWRIWELYE